MLVSCTEDMDRERERNSNDLTEKEFEKVMKVIKRDFDLRNIDYNRISILKNEIEQMKQQRGLLAINDNYYCCLDCHSSFIPFISPKKRCYNCGFNFCSQCFPNYGGTSKSDFPICSFCSRERDFALQKNSWFYNEVGKHYGVTSLLRNMLKKISILFSNYNESFKLYIHTFKKAIEKQQTYCNEDDDNKYNETMKMQKTVIDLLLFSLTHDIKDNDFNHHYFKGVTSDVQIIEGFLSFVLSENEIFRHMNAEKIRKIKKNSDDLSNKITLKYLAESTQWAEENVCGDGNNNENPVRKSNVKKFHYQDDDDNDEVDLESLISFTEIKSKEVPLPPVELPLEYMRKLYGISGEEKIIGGRPLSFIDPDLDTISMTSSSSNISHNCISQEIPRSLISENRVKLGKRGSFIMKNKIPYGINDLYGTERKTIEDKNFDDNSDCDNDDEYRKLKVNLSEDSFKPLIFLPEANTNNKDKTVSSNQKSIDDPDILEDINLSMFKRKTSLGNYDRQQLKAQAYTDDGHESHEVPRFINEPADVRVFSGKSLKVECKVIGSLPIDITWFKYSMKLVELNSLGEKHIICQNGNSSGLEFTTVTWGDDGHYMCLVTNKFGFCQKGFKITVVDVEEIDNNNEPYETVKHCNCEHFGISDQNQKKQRNATNAHIVNAFDRGRSSEIDCNNSLRSSSIFEQRSQHMSKHDSQGETFCLEDGAYCDADVKLKPMELRSVKELCKQFSNESLNNISACKNSSTSQKEGEEKIKKSSDPDFRQHSYVSLSPIPINRGTKPTDSEEKINRPSFSYVMEVQQRCISEEPISSEMEQINSKLKLEHNNDNKSKLNIGGKSFPGNSIGENKLSSIDPLALQTNQIRNRIRTGTDITSYRNIYRKSENTHFSRTLNKPIGPKDVVSISQSERETKNISDIVSQTGSFVSKVIIGSDCDIISSCSDVLQ